MIRLAEVLIRDGYCLIRSTYYADPVYVALTVLEVRSNFDLMFCSRDQPSGEVIGARWRTYVYEELVVLRLKLSKGSSPGCNGV